ncbi:YjeF family domain-containing protein [Exophiala mesophila]|uniref:Enhancer of mRNA-decapping protein 3 n=1 Tax=Exophiala mesophila TaxID=212818 RepID=A0A0D2A3A4_EXOME|nr:YjeF family domain-containing protein [Exophiala mesophila]KIV93473.1 YjeF family domain-containing protein [Exophiala mesophila]
MADAFIGYTILITLQYPPNAQIQGVVANVLDQKLFLRDVLLLWNGQRLASYVLESSAISDLEVSPSQPSRAQEEELKTPVAATHHDNVPPPPSNAAAFVDPAIISYARPPSGTRQNSLTNPSPHSFPPISPIMIADGAVSSPSLNVPRKQTVGSSSVSSIATALPRKPAKRGSAAATLTEPFDALNMSQGGAPTPARHEVAKGKQGGSNVHATSLAPSQTGPGIIDMKDVNHAPLKPAKKPGKGKGWRSTPLIEEVPRPAVQKKSQRGRKVVEDQNGWATEDATDIQDLGDFDFETNLSKFDKRRVFDDIRKDDNIPEGDRLVSFNRQARPGTNGGRNLHYTENVLDTPSINNDKDRWKSEAGETEDDTLEGHYSSGRGSRRAGSRRPLASRKGSVLPAHLERTESPRPLAGLHTASPINGAVTGPRACFRLGHNNKPCHSLSPLQMLELEQLCISELGLTEDMLSENAGRSIAAAILKLPDVRNVVFLVGNHKSGARAIAAARHLRNRRLRVTIVILGGEREELLFEIVRKQLTIYKKGSGYVDRWDEYQAKLTAGGPSPDMIVDAVLGVHVTFEELRTDDQATVLEMTRWANRTAPIVSIDVPCGLSATSGLLTEMDGQSLVMASRYILSLGAPKTGLLAAMAMDGVESTWQVWVLDIGISTAAWQKHGSRRKHGVDFGVDWVVPLKLSMVG